MCADLAFKVSIGFVTECQITFIKMHQPWISNHYKTPPAHATKIFFKCNPALQNCTTTITRSCQFFGLPPSQAHATYYHKAFSGCPAKKSCHTFCYLSLSCKMYVCYSVNANLHLKFSLLPWHKCKCSKPSFVRYIVALLTRIRNLPEKCLCFCLSDNTPLLSSVCCLCAHILS